MMNQPGSQEKKKKIKCFSKKKFHDIFRKLSGKSRKKNPGSTRTRVRIRGGFGNSNRKQDQALKSRNSRGGKIRQEHRSAVQGAWGEPKKR
ncbi:hypothetical protein AUK22_04010 [bacterium CG2_30_54_10]|nr:MAG: hypothetical protein AUK22_04010 [bacterium CG2_30_54_10]